MKQLLFLVMAAGLSCGSMAQQTLSLLPNPFPKTISVTGSAEMEIIPDEIYVQVDLKEYEKKQQGKTGLESIKTDFLNNCKVIGLPDSAISIASYEGYNDYWYKRKKKTDLYASISYQVKFTRSSDIDAFVEKLDEDATQNFRIIKTWHSKMSEYRKQLKIMAVKAAKDKGIYLTEAISEKLGEAITVKEPDENFLGTYNQQWKLNGMASNVAQSVAYENSLNSDNAGIDFRKIKLHYEVSIVFALK